MPQYKTGLRSDLETTLEQVRRHFVRRRRLRQITLFAATTALLVLVFTLALQLIDIALLHNLFIIAFPILWVWAVWRQMVVPFRAPITREQVGLFLDERFPELKNRMINMISVSDPANDEKANMMAEVFLKEAHRFLDKSRFSDYRVGSSFSMGTALTSGRPIRGHFLAFLLLFGSLLTILRYRDLWIPNLSFGWHSVSNTFEVDPGDARVHVGTDQVVFVRSELTGKSVTLRWRHPGADWTTQPMKIGDSDQVHYHRFLNVVETIDYQVTFGANKSAVYTLSTWNPPEVDAIDITHHYPDYLEKQPRELPNSGDIDAIQGSRVVLDVHVNKDLEKVTMVLESGGTVPLERGADHTWTTTLNIDRDDEYHLALLDANGDEGIYNARYHITARTDRAPEVKIDFPHRDMEINALEEVDFDFKVSDDFAIVDYGIRYQVAGREAVEIVLKKSGDPEPRAEGHHRLMLEDMDLSAGDLLTWTIWARDQKPDRDDYETLGDPFFLEIKPFKRSYSEAVSNPGSGGGGGGGPDLVSVQKKVLIATWNLRRKLHSYDEAAYKADLDDIIEAEEGVLQKVNEAAMQSGPGGLIPELVEKLEETLSKLNAADWPKPDKELSQATELEQTVYQLLLKMEPPQSQVARNRSNGQGSGSQRSMAGMKELELKRNRNFYEDEKRTRQEQQAAAEALDKIRDLAQRQKMVNDEIARLVSEQKQAEDEEEIRRRLERLREEARKAIEELDQIQSETSSESMDSQTGERVSEQLQKAREQMNRGLENLKPESLQQARAAGSQAANQLDELEQELQNQAQGSTREQMEVLQQDMAQLQELQKDIQKRVDALGKEKDSPRLTEVDPNQKSKTQLLEEKERLSKEYLELMNAAADTANLVRNSQELASRKLGDWLRQSSKKGVLEDIEETGKLLKNGVWEDLPQKEAAISRKLKEAADALDLIAGNTVDNDLAAREKALEKLQALEKKIGAEASKQMANRKAGEKGGAPSDSEQSGSGEMSEKELKEMQRFAQQEYRDWIEGLEGAEQLLPGRSPVRDEISKVRRQVKKMRRDFRRDHLVPKFDMYLDEVAGPLVEVTEMLEKDIAVRKKEREFLLRDEGQIPDQYRKNVSEYFRALSESEGG